VQFIVGIPPKSAVKARDRLLQPEYKYSGRVNCNQVLTAPVNDATQHAANKMPWFNLISDLMGYLRSSVNLKTRYR